MWQTRVGPLLPIARLLLHTERLQVLCNPSKQSQLNVTAGHRIRIQKPPGIAKHEPGIDSQPSGAQGLQASPPPFDSPPLPACVHSVWPAKGVFAQRGHSANYYDDYPGNNPENHAPAESCTIDSKLKKSNI